MPELPKIIDKNIEHFTGRTWLLPALLEWFECSDQRVFLLTGGPGTGKSMILAWLTGKGPAPKHSVAQAQLQALRSAVKAVHFCQADCRNITPQAFAESIANQLIGSVQGFGEALVATLSNLVQISVTQTIGTVAADSSITGVSIGHIDLGTLGDELSFDRAFTQPLNKLYASGYSEPMLLLVDALDEAQTYTGQVTLPDLLSRLVDLPSQVRLLVTSREEPRVLKFYRDVKPFDLIKKAHPDVDDVRTYGEGRLAELSAVEEAKRRDFAQRLAQKAKGVFLYAAAVLDELLAHPPGALPELDAYPLPDGLSGLYHSFLTRELGKDDARWFNLYEPLLGLVVVAQGEGLTSQQLDEIVGKDTRAVLRACKQYLAGELPNGPFRPFHKSFADFLLNDPNNTDFHIDPVAMHARISEHFQRKYGADWLECHEEYALANLPSHLLFLLGEKQVEKALQSLLTDLRFLESKTRLMGVFAVLADLAAARRKLSSLNTKFDESSLAEVSAALDGESHHLRDWNPDLRPASFMQQVMVRANRLRLAELANRASSELINRGCPHLVERWGSGRPSDGLVRTLAGHVGKVWAVAASSDGEKVLSGGNDGTIRIWNLATGEELHTIVGHQGRVRAIGLIDDGQRFVSTGADGVVRVWELSTGRAIDKLEGHGCEVLSLVWIPQAAKLVTGDKKGWVRIWNLQDRTAQVIRAHTGEVRSLALVPYSDLIVSASSDRRARVWNCSTNEYLAELNSEGATLRTVCVSSDGRRVFCSASDGTIKLWPLNTNMKSTSQPVAVHCTGHQGRVRSLALTDDGKHLISGAEDRLIKVWDAVSQSGPDAVATVKGHSGTIWAIASVPKSSLFVSGSEDGAIKVWDLEGISGSPSATQIHNNQLFGHGSRVCAVVASEAGDVVLSGARDGIIKCWKTQKTSLSNGQMRTECFDLLAHEEEITSLAIGSTSQMAISGSCDKSICVWDLVVKAKVQSLKVHRKAITCLQFGANEMTALSAGEDGALIVSSIDGQTKVVLSGHRARVSAIAFEPRSNCLISGDVDGFVALWSAALPEATSQPQVRKPIWISREHCKAVLDIAVSSNREQAVTVGVDGLIKVWALPKLESLAHGGTIKYLCSLSGHEGPVLRVAITLDGDWAITVSSDGTVRAWDLTALEAPGNTARQRQNALIGSVKRPIALIVAGKTDRFATISAEGLLDVWSIGSVSPVTGGKLNNVASTFLEHELTCIAATSDGKYFYVGDRVGDIACFYLFEPD